MTRPRLRIGELGAIAWDTRGLGSVRGRARTLDAAGNSQRIAATGPDQEAVERELHRRAALLGAAACGEWSTLTPVGYAAAAHLAELSEVDPDEKPRAPQTLVVYASTIDSLISGRIGALTLGELTPVRVAAWVEGLKVDGYRAATRRRALTLLRGMCDLAVRRGAIGSNPCAAEHAPRPLPRTPVALTRVQVDALRAAVLAWERAPRGGGPAPDRTLRTVIDIGLGTGMRIGEILALRPRDVELAPTTALVAVTGTVVMAPVDGRMSVIRQDRLKSDGAQRRLALPDFAKVALLDAMSRMADPTDQDAPIRQGRGGVWKSPSNVRTAWRRMREHSAEQLEAAGIDLALLTPHIMRRSVVSAIGALPGGLERAQEQAGHASSTTTRLAYMARHELPIVEGLDGVLEVAFRPSSGDAIARPTSPQGSGNI